ncbi:MAG: MvaI/BcnI family restriction endonuclease [bacterium]|nr:MvaI/BcnI family restriction endonuclease [bacterium]
MVHWTLPQIKCKLKIISKKGWIKGLKFHDTGIGKTLEEELGIKENNIALPDFGTMELKSQRAGTSSMLTLFTKCPQGVTNAEIRKKFGYPDKNFPKIKILHQTINGGRKNAQGFRCKVDAAKKNLLVTKGSKIVGYYSLAFVKAKAVEKIGNGLILVLADSKKINGQEYFKYKTAYLLKNIDPAKFLLHSQYDMRLGVYQSGPNKGRPHDHGSAFRIKQKAISALFRTKESLL